MYLVAINNNNNDNDNDYDNDNDNDNDNDLFPRVVIRLREYLCPRPSINN